HPLLGVRHRLHPATDHSDVLPRRPAVRARSDLPVGPGRARQGTPGGPVRPGHHPARVGARVPVGHRARRDADAGMMSSLTETPAITPAQTVGPFFGYALPYAEGPSVVPPTRPDAITVRGLVLDGAGEPLPDALVEIWQADAAGTVPRGDGAMRRA